MPLGNYYDAVAGIGNSFAEGQLQGQRNALIAREVAQDDATRNALLGYLSGPQAGSPEAMNSLLAADPQQAAQVQAFQENRRAVAQAERQAKALEQYTQAQYVLKSANPAMSMRLLDSDGRFMAQLQEAGLIDPADGMSDDEARIVAQYAVEQAAPIAGILPGGSPDQRVQSTQVLESGEIALVLSDGTIKPTGMMARNPMQLVDFQGGRGAFDRNTGQITPISTAEDEAAGAATIAGAEAAARAEAEAAAAQSAKSPALDSMRYVASTFEPAFELTPTGGAMGLRGLVGGVFDYQDASRFDNLAQQLSTELRTVFRIPGEGTLSDREQAQYGLQLPSRRFSPPVNRAILQDLITRAEMRVGAEPAAPAGWSAEAE